MIVGDIIRRNAALYGDREGLIFEGRRYTHREFARRVYRAANALLARGVQPQQRIAILARNCSELLEIFGAGEVAGFIIVNINHRLSIPEICGICADAEPSVFVFEPDFAEAAAAVRAKFPGIRHFIGIGTAAAGAEELRVRDSGRVGGRTGGAAFTGGHRLSDLHQRHHRPPEGRHVLAGRHVGIRAHLRA